MNNEEQQSDVVKKYLNLFFNKHKLIIGCLLLALSVSFVIYLTTPKVYESTASIIYQQQKINPSKLSQNEEKRIDEMVNTVTQQVVSRTSLEKIIQEFNLYPEMREKVPIEDVIEQMRTQHIRIRVEKTKGNVFTVSYQGTEPRVVMRVTNALASKFIEENLRVREERATETSSYIQDELRMSKESLDKKDALMRDYKLKYYNEMPDQRQSNMERLNALHEQYQATQTNIHTLEQTRLLVSEQLASQRNRANSTGSAASTGGENNTLAAARLNLQGLMARYTPDHPAVKRAEGQVKQLESEQQNNPAASAGLRRTASAASPDTSNFAVQLKEIELNLKTLREESEKILVQTKTYQGWIDTTPIREAEWVALTRDYNELRKYYDALLAQSLTAAAAESIEMRQKGSQFKLVDSAYLPEKPMQGNFLKIIMIAIGAGLAGGFGIALGLDIMDTSFKTIQELESFLKIPVTCALPLIVLEAERKQTKRKNIIWYCIFAAWLLLLVTGAVALWLRGSIII